MPPALIQAARLAKSRGSAPTGTMMATVPMIRPMLQIHDPTAFPSAIPESPMPLAVADTTSSGVVVARLTRVPPMMNRGMPRARPMWTLESTKQVATLGDQAESKREQDDIDQQRQYS